MKKILSAIPVFLFFVSARSQNDRYEFYSGNSTVVYQKGKSALLPLNSAITSEKLCSAKLMSDIIPDYPTSYYNSIIDYVSVEICSVVNGSIVTAANNSDILNKEQKSALDNADISSSIGVKIHFKYKDPANDGMGSGRKIKEMNFAVNVIPAVEAEYSGGIEELSKYLKSKVLDLMPVTATSAKVPNVSVIFTVNEEGYTSDVKIGKNSTDPTFDKLFVEAVNNMPKWKPAENAKGNKVKQQFTIGIPMAKRGC